MTVYTFGFRAGILAFSSTVAFVVAQTLQLAGLLHYPFDEILIYGTSLCIVVPFILEVTALHYVVQVEKKFWSHAALLFAVMYGMFVTANYVVQLATVIPATLKGSTDDIRILAQTPHSMFWDFDAIGYIFMGFTTLLTTPLFLKQGFQRWVRYSFIVHSLVTPLIAFVYFYPDFSNELLLLGIPWGITAPLAMLMLALYLRRMKPTDSTAPVQRH